MNTFCIQKSKIIFKQFYIKFKIFRSTRYKIYLIYKILYVNEDNIRDIGKYIDLLTTIFSEILMITEMAKNINEPVGRNIKMYSKHKRFFIV